MKGRYVFKYRDITQTSGLEAAITVFEKSDFIQLVKLSQTRWTNVVKKNPKARAAARPNTEAEPQCSLEALPSMAAASHTDAVPGTEKKLEAANTLSPSPTTIHF